MRRSPILLSLALLASIVVPFIIWGDAIEAYSTGLLEGAAPSPVLASILIALLAGDLVLPVPSSIVAVGAGAVFGALVGAGIVAVGFSLGAWVGYELGRSAGRSGVARWVDDPQRERLEEFMARHGVGLLVALRAVPVLAEASVVVAGAAGMARRRVLLATTGSSIVLALVYALAGQWAADAGSLEGAAMASLGIPGLAMLLARRLRTRAGD
ncbi:MAG: VTT domain-containing protein [Myxococcota bacterium]